MVVFLALSILTLASTALASISLNVSTTPSTQSSATANTSSTSITVTGSIVNTTTSDTISGINVSVTIGGNNYWALTGTNGSFSFNVTAPTTVGEYVYNVTTNSTSLPNKTFSSFVSNGTSATVSFIGRFPPFTNGTTFTINVTMFNGTSPLVTSTPPRIRIFEANGQNVSWTVTALQSITNASGAIGFNVAVPSDASAGEYGIDVDYGKAFSIFRVGSAFQLAVNTLTTNDEVVPSFTPGSTAVILAKLRANGNPVTGATVTAVVTYPNGTTTKNITLSAHPSSEGYYNNTFATEANVRGTYKVKVGALTGGNDVAGSTTLITSSFTGRIEPVKNAFFFEWGGKSAFKPGESISLDMVTTNLGTGDVIAWNNCSASTHYKLVTIAFVNGTNTTLGNASVSYATGQYLPNVNICRVTFTAPSTSGTYNIKVNVTALGDTQTLDGFFAVSNHFLKVTPVLDVGGFEGFEQVFAPGNNITLTLKAINVSGNSEVNRANITGHIVTRLLPLDFIGGSSEVKTITQSSHPGVNSAADPNITFVLPSTMIGPILIEISATVNSSAGTSYIAEGVTGTAFIIANYLEGFMGPQKGSGLPTHEGETSGGFNADAQCSGTQTFAGTITDVNTSTAAQGATIVGILEAREEETGKDVKSFLSIAGTTSSNSNGAISTNVTFAPTGGYSFSGNYFMIFNASYKGRSAGVPSFFMCRTLNIGFPQIKAVGSNQQFSWQVSPTSGLNVTVTNVAHMNGTLISSGPSVSSIFTITRIFNFNPSTGTMQVLTNRTPMEVNFSTVPGTSNSATLSVYPQNYSLSGVALTKWPNGFFDMRPRVVSNLGTDTSFGGFMVVAFDAFPEFQFGQQYAAGSVQSIVVRAATNVSNFTVSMGRPWEGQLLNATVDWNPANTLLLADGWNNSDDTGNFSSYADCQNPQNCAGPYERWNVTFTVPNTLRKGGTMLTIKVVSSATGLEGESVEVPLFVTVSKFNIVTPFEEDLGIPSTSPMDAYYVLSNAHPNPGSEATSVNYGWNLDWINSAYGINSTSGRVCIKSQLNTTKFTNQGQQSININGSGTKIVVLDRFAQGVYDTVILNRSNETVVLNTTNIGNRTIGGQMYLWDIKDCGFFRIVNVNETSIKQGGNFISNNNGGSQQSGASFTVPYVVVSSGARQNNVPVSIKSVAKQDNRGFGFEGKLTPAENTKTGDYNVTGASTNADGLAFVTLQVVPSGRLMAFWTATVGSESDTADMSTATTLEIKGFSTSAQSVTPLTSGVLTLVNDTNNRTGSVNVTIGGRDYWIFNGTATETIDGDFVSNGVADVWNVIYNASNNKIKILNATGSTANLADATQSSHNGSLSLSIYTSVGVIPLSSPSLKIGEWNNGTSANSYTKTAVLFTSSSGSPSQYVATTATQNITALICAEGYEKPTARPVENATINVSVTDWSSFPPSIKYLDMFKISDGSKASQANPIVTSPVGCALVRIGPGQLGSWPSASSGKPPVFIEGTVTKTVGSSEFVYVGDVFRP